MNELTLSRRRFRHLCDKMLHFQQWHLIEQMRRNKRILLRLRIPFTLRTFEIGLHGPDDPLRAGRRVRVGSRDLAYQNMQEAFREYAEGFEPPAYFFEFVPHARSRFDRSAAAIAQLLRVRRLAEVAPEAKAAPKLDQIGAA